MMKFSRTWAMPNSDTFSIAPIKEFVARYLCHGSGIDPFARNSELVAFRNDLNPETKAESHMDAGEYLKSWHGKGQFFGLMLFDPPYSPRQISESYKQVGREVGMAGTQNGALYKRVRDAAMPVSTPNAIVLSFGWNSAGMGQKRGFGILELMLVAHGSAHNDTICLAEKRVGKMTQPEL